jgi:hypothetical protein
LYILEEAVRNGFDSDAAFSDLNEKIHQRVREGPCDWHESICYEEKIPETDCHCAERLEAAQKGFPTLAKLSLAETQALQLQAYMQRSPALLCNFLNDAEPDVQHAIVEREYMVSTEDPPMHLSSVRNLLRSCPATLQAGMTLARLQYLLAKINNAELRAYYEGLSQKELRGRFADCGVSLPHSILCDATAMRARLVETDTVWASSRTIHPLEVLVHDLRPVVNRDPLGALIHERLGSMSTAGLRKYMREPRDWRTSARCGQHAQAGPGRGIPRLRFCRKMKGLSCRIARWKNCCVRAAPA